MKPGQVAKLMTERDWCYAIPIGQDPQKHGGYVPSVVIRNVSGHWPMTGRDGGEPWIWGQKLKAAEDACAAKNAQRGITKDKAWEITCSTHF